MESEKDINTLGVQYEPEMNKCKFHRLNNLQVKLDLRDNWMPLELIERKVNEAFVKTLKYELKSAGIEKVHKIEWDRMFVIGPLWDVRQFTVRFFLKLYGVDMIEDTDPHICRA